MYLNSIMYIYTKITELQQIITVLKNKVVRLNPFIREYGSRAPNPVSLFIWTFKRLSLTENQVGLRFLTVSKYAAVASGKNEGGKLLLIFFKKLETKIPPPPKTNQKSHQPPPPPPPQKKKKLLQALCTRETAVKPRKANCLKQLWVISHDPVTGNTLG